MLSTQPVGGPPAPTQAQLDAVNSGEMTPDQLVAQLAAAQGQQQQATMAAQVAPVSDLASVAASAVSALPGMGPCTSNLFPPTCDYTVYLIGGGILLGLIFLLPVLMPARR